MNRILLVLPVALALAISGAGLAASSQPDQSLPWREFSGTWSASGQRYTLPTGGARLAATVHLSGAVVLADGSGLGRGFRGQVLGFDDGADLVVLRAVWTDDRGDSVFSRLEGEPLETGRRFVGTITGGTGRYVGVTGEYAFTWQYVVESDEGTIQGRTLGMTGRVRGPGIGR